MESNRHHEVSGTKRRAREARARFRASTPKHMRGKHRPEPHARGGRQLREKTSARRDAGPPLKGRRAKARGWRQYGARGVGGRVRPLGYQNSAASAGAENDRKRASACIWAGFN